MRFGLSWNYSLLILASSLAFFILWFLGARGKMISIILQIALMLIFAHTLEICSRGGISLLYWVRS